MGYFSILKTKFSDEITFIPEFLAAKNYPALTGLRGVAIIIVLLYHLGINRILRHYDAWLTGRLGVDIFFVLSGFLITTILIKEKINIGYISLKKFYARRALRILPVAYLFLFVLMFINYFFKINISTKSFVFGFLYIKNLPVSGINDNWTNHFWSLSVEEQFYLYFPLLLVLGINKAGFFASVAIGLILLFSLFGINHFSVFYTNKLLYDVCRLAMYLFWEGGFPIFIGCLFAILSFKKIIDLEKFRNNHFLSAFIFITVIVIHSSSFYFYKPYLSEFLVDILTGIIILLSINSKNLFSSLLQTRFLMWMGTISYSIYIWQQIFVRIPAYWVNSRWLGLSYNSLLFVADLLRLIAILITACLSYYFFERRFLKLKHRFE